MSEMNHRDLKNAISDPATWDVQTLHKNCLNSLVEAAKENDLPLPLKRIEQQMEQNTIYQDIMKRWPRMDSNERLRSWKILLRISEKIIQEVLPACVQCGECCRKGSPTLHLDDLELLREGKIPWNQLITLRKGEPVRSPFENKLFPLLDERIKIREKTGTVECVFLESATDRCSIYVDRPLQCRAQACWEPAQMERQSAEPYLTRRDLFADIELLMEIIREHDSRCAFARLERAVEALRDSQGKTIDQVLEMLAYEDHYRNFFGKEFNIPEDTLDLVFGRSFADLVAIFGLKVIREEDGSRRLVVDQSENFQAG